MTSGSPAQDQLFGAVLKLGVPAGAAPIYPAGPHCNQIGLTDLGEYVVRRMLAKGMIVDPDHLSVYARRQLLNLTESEGYSGVISSHSWSTTDAEQRILDHGGLVTPYAGGSTGFVGKWKAWRTKRNPRWRTGWGYGADANGLGSQGGPRGAGAKNPVTYPFKSFDGSVTFEKQQSGTKTFDINRDGVAHYGLYADWYEDLRKLGGDAILKDMSTGADSFFRSWERAVGISPETCRRGRLRFTKDGLGLVTLAVTAEEVLRGAGQPSSRKGRTWRWCVADRGNKTARVRAAFTPAGTVALIGSTVARHRIDGIGRGAKASTIRGAKRFGSSRLLVRNAGSGRRFVYGVSAGGKVRWTAVATGAVAKTPASLRSYLRVAGLR